jgi:hypothetical protein
MLGWDWCGFHKKRIGKSYVELVFLHLVGYVSRSVFWCVRGVKHRCTIFHACVRLIHIPQKARKDMLYRTCVLHLIGSVGHVVNGGA